MLHALLLVPNSPELLDQAANDNTTHVMLLPWPLLPPRNVQQHAPPQALSHVSNTSLAYEWKHPSL
jgi:hypothetical protein